MCCGHIVPIVVVTKIDTCPGPQPNSSGWDLGLDGKLWNGRNGRSGSKLSHSSDVIGACNC